MNRYVYGVIYNGLIFFTRLLVAALTGLEKLIKLPLALPQFFQAFPRIYRCRRSGLTGREDFGAVSIAAGKAAPTGFFYPYRT